MKILRYELVLEEPVLLTRPGGDPNTDESQRFIPGSAIRGMLAHQYWRKHGNSSKAEFSRIFLTGDTRFLNAYPSLREQRTLPTPQHWATEKDVDDQIVHNRIIPTDIMPKPIGDPFMLVENNAVYAHTPQYHVSVHNARNREKGRAVPEDRTNRSALFRYHALAKGQTFVGRILIEDAAKATMLQSLLEGTFLLGGSKTAGYGLTAVTHITPLIDDSRELGVYQDIPAGEPFLVYLTSDAIVRHPKTGQPGAYLQEVLQAKLSGHRLTMEKAYGRMGWVGGFNTKWGLPLPQTYALLKGSVWQFKSDKIISKTDIQKIELAGIGERLAEGFGSLLIAPQLPSQPKLADDVQSKKQPRTAVSLSTPSTNLLQQMNHRLIQQALDRHLATAVTAMSKGGIRLSNSQLARIRLKVRQETNRPQEKFKQFRQYLQGTKERKSADDQFRKSRIKGQDLRDWLYTLAAQPEQIWREMNLKPEKGWEKGKNGWQRLLLGSKPFVLNDKLNEKLAHQYTIRMIDALCDQKANERRSK